MHDIYWPQVATDLASSGNRTLEMYGSHTVGAYKCWEVG